MSTVSEIVQAAFREGNIVAIGETPTDAEIAEAIPRLNSYLQSLFGHELGEQFRDWFVPSHTRLAPLRALMAPLRSVYRADGTPLEVPFGESWRVVPPNSRIIAKLTEAGTLYFPSTPNDGARMTFRDVGSAGDVTIDAVGRLIEGSATLTAAPSELNGRQWLYRADLGNWIRTDEDLEAGDEVYLPREFDDLLITGLLLRISRRFGVSADRETIARNEDMVMKLKHRYRQTEEMPGDITASRMFPDNPATYSDFPL